MSAESPYSKERLDFYLRELGKEYKKRCKGVPTEMILIGGASILINYGFRESTYDVDAAYAASVAMRDAISAVENKFGLPHRWINDDFKTTPSYTSKIRQYSKYYKTFANVLEVRTVCEEYLLCMKLVSGRKYKKDLSDIVGILSEQRSRGRPLTYDTIDRAMNELYGGWDRVDEFTKQLLDDALASDELEKMFAKIKIDEEAAKSVVVELVQKYPRAAHEDNIDDVLKAIANKKKE